MRSRDKRALNIFLLEVDSLIRIIETKFGEKNNPKFTEAYAKLNSYILNELYDLLKVKLDKEGECSTGKEWHVRIEDRHLHASGAHYLFELEEGNAPFDKPLTVNYFNYHSYMPDSISYGPGKISIYAYGNFGDYTPEFMKKFLAYNYQQALKKYFPEYFYVVNEEAYR